MKAWFFRLQPSLKFSYPLCSQCRATLFVPQLLFPQTLFSLAVCITSSHSCLQQMDTSARTPWQAQGGTEGLSSHGQPYHKTYPQIWPSWEITPTSGAMAGHCGVLPYRPCSLFSLAPSLALPPSTPFLSCSCLAMYADGNDQLGWDLECTHSKQSWKHHA